MGTLSPWHLLILGLLLLIIFGGKGKLSSIMGDAAKGIRAFKDGLKGEEEAKAAQPAQPLPRTEPEKEEAHR